MRPYAKSLLKNEARDIFKLAYYLLRARRAIENIIGILPVRQHILQTLIHTIPNIVTIIVLA